MRVDRLNQIEQYVLQKGSVSLEELAAVFCVSMNTIRRDVVELVHRGQMKKVYGGVAAQADKVLLPMSVRKKQQHEAKRAIGALAARLVQDDMTIFLDSGSTTVHVLPYLSAKKNITVITHSLSALYEAAKYPELNIIALGGQYSLPTSSYVGAATLHMLSEMSIGLVFIAATGVSIEKGLTNNTYLEADIKRSVTNRNHNVVLLADQTKFDRTALITFCELSKLSAVVSNIRPQEQYIQYFAQHNIDVYLANP